jgi:hypothetical protein
MSDLEKLIKAERDSASLTESAVAEANRKRAQTRIDVQKECTRHLAEKAKELEEKLEKERERLSADRGEKNRVFLENLRTRRLATDEFRLAVFRIIFPKQG